jgi:hypothetical protein
MAEGVPVVEQQATHGPVGGLLVLVGADHGRLDQDGGLDQGGEGAGVGGHRRPGRAGQGLGQAGVAGQPGLGHLGQAGADLGRRQSGQGVQVGHHRHRLVEGADQVLAFGEVDPGLAPDGGVDHAEHGGGHVDQRHPAQPGGGGEPGDVGGGAAADRHQRVGPPGGDGGQPLVQPGHHLQPLGVLPRRDLDQVDGQPAPAEGPAGPPGQGGQRPGGDHGRRLGPRERRQQLVEPVQQPGPDEHRVAASGEVHLDRPGCRAAAQEGCLGAGRRGQRPAMAPTRRRYHSMTSTATCSTLCRSVSMATSPAVS